MLPFSTAAMGSPAGAATPTNHPLETGLRALSQAASLDDLVDVVFNQVAPRGVLAAWIWLPGENRISLRLGVEPVARSIAGAAAESFRETAHAPLLLEQCGAAVPQAVAAALRDLGTPYVSITPLTARSRSLALLGLAANSLHSLGDGGAAEFTRLMPVLAIALENVLLRARLAGMEAQNQQHLLQNEEDEGPSRTHMAELVGRSRALLKVLFAIDTVAPSEATALILGETGTGKELIARAIHRLSRRAGGPFVRVNCAAIPAGLLESELFGHEKGAFTGAIAQRMGRFELAHRGTMFLDEIGELPLELQPKLLRVIQERTFERVGGSRTLEVDVRIVAATNRDLRAMSEQNQFRPDLFYRLHVFPIGVPALRERREDIPVLVRHFVNEIGTRFGKRIKTIPAHAMNALVNYDWPGNIRELENLIERSVILTRGDSLAVPVAELANKGALAQQTLEVTEREHILRVLEKTNWRVSGPRGAAAVLGLKRTTLYSRMRRLGIERERPLKTPPG